MATRVKSGVWIGWESAGIGCSGRKSLGSFKVVGALELRVVVGFGARFWSWDWVVASVSERSTWTGDQLGYTGNQGAIFIRVKGAEVKSRGWNKDRFDPCFS